RHAHERAAFLERHVRRALDQRARGALRDAGERAHRAGADQHAARRRGAGGRRGAAVAVVVEDDAGPVPRPRAQVLLALDADLLAQQPPARRGDDQPHRHARAVHHLERAHGVRRAGRAGDRERDGRAVAVLPCQGTPLSEHGTHNAVVTSRSTSVSTKKLVDTPTLVWKNARSMRFRSSAPASTPRSDACAKCSSTAITPTPPRYAQPTGNVRSAHGRKNSPTAARWSSRATSSARRVPSRAG